MDTLTDSTALELVDQALHIDSDVNVDDLAGYLSNMLPAEEMREWNDHLEHCSRCREVVTICREVDEEELRG